MPTSPTPTGTELPLLTECCTPVVRKVIQPIEAEVLAGGFKALADPARLRLISLVAAQQGGEACVCELTDPIGLSQPTVSHHLKNPGRRRHSESRTTRQMGLLPGGASNPQRPC